MPEMDFKKMLVISFLYGLLYLMQINKLDMLTYLMKYNSIHFS